MLFFTHAQPRLRHKIPERQRLWQFLHPPQQIRFYFFVHHFQRAVVPRQMMQQPHHQPAIILLVISDVGPQKRRLAHIDSVVPRIISLIQLFAHLPRRRIQLHLFHRQRRFPPHHLHRLGQSFPHHPVRNMSCRSITACNALT